MYRAAQEGIVCAFNYGLKILNETGISPNVIRAGHANLFLSPLFREMFTNMTGVPLELYRTDGSQGAALGAGFGAGYYKSTDEAFQQLEQVESIEPEPFRKTEYNALYDTWAAALNKTMS